MVSLKYLNIYVLLLRCFGVCPARFSQEEQKLVYSVRDLFIAKSITVIILIVMESLLLFIIYMAFSSELNLYGDFHTGNTLFIFHLISSSVVQLIQSVFLFIFKGTVVELLNIIYKHTSTRVYAEKSSTGGMDLDLRFQSTFLFHAIILVIHELNCLSAIWTFDISLKLLFCLSLAMTFRPVFCCIVMSSYTYVVFVLCRFLAFYNDILIEITTSQLPARSKLQEILALRGELISLSCQQLSQIYGVAMLLETCYILTVLPSFPAFMLMIFDRGIRGNILIMTLAGRALVWVLPPFMILLQALAINTMNSEANRTVKILAKFPRTGTGLDKMVDKFLLKNVRKKPILTAYGFFPLDRSALFKLFTAILMYIMILVQFKDIEKSLEHGR